MIVYEWEQFLEAKIKKLERMHESWLNTFEKRKNLPIHDIFIFSLVEDDLEFWKTLLTNLRIDINFLSEMKTRIKKFIETNDQREQEWLIDPERTNLKPVLIKNLIKLNVDQHIKFLKLGILTRQELIEREALKGGKTPFLVDLEKGLKQSMIDLNNLEKNPSYIDVLRKKLENSLDGKKLDNSEDKEENPQN